MNTSGDQFALNRTGSMAGSNGKSPIRHATPHSYDKPIKHLHRPVKDVTVRVQIKSFGIYRLKAKGQCALPEAATGYRNQAEGSALIEQTDHIPLQKGLSFGLTFVPAKQTVGQLVRLRRIYRFPAPGLKNPNTGKTYLFEEFIEEFALGKACTLSYSFDQDYEMLPGEWIFEIWDANTKLAEKSFFVAKEVSDAPLVIRYQGLTGVFPNAGSNGVTVRFPRCPVCLAVRGSDAPRRMMVIQVAQGEYDDLISQGIHGSCPFCNQSFRLRLHVSLEYLRSDVKSEPQVSASVDYKARDGGRDYRTIRLETCLKCGSPFGFENNGTGGGFCLECDYSEPGLRPP